MLATYRITRILHKKYMFSRTNQNRLACITFGNHLAFYHKLFI